MEPIDPRYDNNDTMITPTVYCDVSNCTYHDGVKLCNADHIRVGPAHAISSADTACATFIPKK